MFFSLFLLSIYPKAQLPFHLFSSQTIEVFSNNDNNIHFMTDKEQHNKSVVVELPIFRNKNRSGLDERNISNFTENCEIINKIETYFHKFYLLRFLQNKSIIVIEKLKKIECMEKQEENSWVHNITKGGLFDDWDSEIM
jgi:hypothetical protein